MPLDKKDKAFHNSLCLALLCQHPGCEHLACQEKDAYTLYTVKQSIQNWAPQLQGLKTILGYAKLTGLSVLKEWDSAVAEAVGAMQEFLSQILGDVGTMAGKGEAPRLLKDDISAENPGWIEKQVTGAALRQFRALLDKLDPAHQWQGLVKRRSNDTGDLLWVCEKHAADPDYAQKRNLKALEM